AVVAAVALAVAAALLASPAAAARGGGSGQLHVVSQGTAYVDVQGRVVALGVLPQPSRLEVKGRPGAFRVTVDGEVQRPNRRGLVRLLTAGRLFVQSIAPVRIRIQGADLDVSFAGRGQAFLSGAGTYSLNGSADEPWPGTPILIKPTPRRGRGQGQTPTTSTSTRG
ncbi:MAG: hypothetical protein AB1416_12425, partial [Actinomycetota bacterium]